MKKIAVLALVAASLAAGPALATTPTHPTAQPRADGPYCFYDQLGRLRCVWPINP